GFTAKGVDKLDGRAELVQRRNLEHVGIIKVEHAFVGVFGQQGIEDGAGLLAITVEYVALLDVVGAFLAGQRFGVEGDVAGQIEGVQILGQLVDDGVERQALVFQFFEQGLLALGLVPAFEKVVQAGEALFQGAAGVVAQGFGNQLAVGVQVFDPLGDNFGADAVDVDLFALFFLFGLGRCWVLNDGFVFAGLVVDRQTVFVGGRNLGRV